MTIIGSFYYLADFDFESQLSVTRATAIERHLNNTLNESERQSSTKDHLLSKNKRQSEPLPATSSDSLSNKKISQQVLEKVRSVENFNWAWEYRRSDAEEWVQFDCTDCLILEFNYQAYSICAKEKFKTCKIIKGVVDIGALTLLEYRESRVWQVRRSRDN